MLPNIFGVHRHQQGGVEPLCCEMKGADAFASGDGNSALGGLFPSN